MRTPFQADAGKGLTKQSMWWLHRDENDGRISGGKRRLKSGSLPETGLERDFDAMGKCESFQWVKEARARKSRPKGG